MISWVKQPMQWCCSRFCFFFSSPTCQCPVAAHLGLMVGWLGGCGCNFFGCNCETAVLHLVREGYCRCKFSEFCPDRRRRKRSLHEPISQAYSGLFPNYLIEQAAMENFFSFDLNQDGLISLEEVTESYGSNGTEDGFKQVDVDNDGFVRPSEFDFSLNWSTQILLLNNDFWCSFDMGLNVK